MKALILFLFSLGCYAAFLESYDQFADQVGGGGGGGGVTFATNADVNVGTANVAIDAALYRPLAVQLTGVPAGSTSLGTFPAIAAVPARQAQYDNQNLKTIINQILLDTAATSTPISLKDADNDTGIDAERTTDNDTLILSTAGFDRMIVEPDGDVTVDATTFVVSAVNNAVGINTTAPNVSAVLDVNSTAKGVLIPRMTTVQRTAIATPADGLLVYDTDVNDFMYYDSSLVAWKYLNRRMTDIDNDTSVVLDSASDDDNIRFNTAGLPRMALDNTGSLALGTTIPANATAILDVSATGKGVLLPRLTTAQKTGIVTPATGLVVYDTDLGTFSYYDGAAWISLTSIAKIDDLNDVDTATVAPVADDLLAFDGANWAPTKLVINDLTDVDTVSTAPVTSNILTYNGASWVPSAPALIPINSLTDVDTVTVAPATNDILKFNGASWVPSTQSAGSVIQDTDADTTVEVIDVADEDNIIVSTAGTTAASFLANGTNYIGDVVTNANDEGITFHGTTLNVGIGNSAPYANSMLDVNSTTKGVTIPRLSTAELGALGTANGTAAASDGMLVFLEDEDSLVHYDPTLQIWKNLTQSIVDADNDTYVKVAETDADRVDFRARGVDAMSIHPGTGTVGVKVGGTNTVAPPTTSIFDVESTTQGSRPMPSMTQAQRDAIVTPVTGLRVFNTDTNRPNWYNGTTWLEVQDTTAGGGGGATFNASKTWIVNSGDGPFQEIVYSGKYFFVGGSHLNDVGFAAIMGGIEGASAAALRNDIEVKPVYSSVAGRDSVDSTITRVGIISELINTGNYAYIIDGDGRLITYGGHASSSANNVLGNCSSTQLEGQIGYVIGSDPTCNTDGVNTIPTTGWKAVAVLNAYDRQQYNSACAIDSTDAVWCWGDNQAGQLGVASSGNDILVPTKVTTYFNTDTAAVLTMPSVAKVIGMRDGHTGNTGRNMAIITTAGVPMIAGLGQYGNNGDGATTDNNRFTTLAGDLSPASLGTAGATVVDMWHHGGYAGGYCAIKQLTGSPGQRQLYCWGYNAVGAVGNGNTTNQSTPVLIDFTALEGANYTVVAGASSQGNWTRSGTCVIVGNTLAATSGELYCWGYNGQGQVGDGTNTLRSSPTKVSGNFNGQWTKIWMNDVHVSENAASSYSTSINCGYLDAPKKTYCWGYAEGDVLGDKSSQDGAINTVTTNSFSAPKLVIPMVGATMHDIQCKPWGNQNYCLGVDTEGEVYCSVGSETENACPGGSPSQTQGGFHLTVGKQLYLK